MCSHKMNIESSYKTYVLLSLKVINSLSVQTAG